RDDPRRRADAGSRPRPAGPWPSRLPSRGRGARVVSSLADVREEGHEAGPLDGVLDGPLEGGAVTAALAAKELALAGAELLEVLHVLVVDERRPRAALFGAEPAAVLPPLALIRARHRWWCPRLAVFWALNL